MKNIIQKFRIYLLIPALALLLITCNQGQVEEVKVDLPQIKEKGKLTALVSYGPTSYFLYRGQTMGYEYELLQRLADYLDLELEIKIAKNLNELATRLRKGEGDIIAHSLAITESRKEKFNFTNPHRTTQQMLIQRKPEGWKDMPQEKMDSLLVRDTTELAGKEVWVRKNSSYYTRLKKINEHLDEKIDIQEAPGTAETAALIQKVADGEIDYTVADQNIARINTTTIENIDIQTPISDEQEVAWGVRHASPKLKEAIDNWLQKMKKNVDYYVIYNKYFKNRRLFKVRQEDVYSSITGSNQVSEYDTLFKKYARQINWDWRLLASQSYQESRFDPTTTSWAGAAGLMQLMPRTAKSYGVTNLYNPENSIKAGIHYIKDLKKFWKDIPDTTERRKFVLASYNAGQYHIKDAQRLAKKLGKDPQIWDENVAECILLKSRKEYFNDEVVKYGYCRGREPFNYVKEILNRYQQYKDILNQSQAELEEFNEDETS